jgi:hypothetical protein
MLLLGRLLSCHGDQLLIGSYDRLHFSLPLRAEKFGLFAGFLNVLLPPPDFGFAALIGEPLSRSGRFSRLDPAQNVGCW